MAYSIFGDSFVSRLRRHTEGEMGFSHPIKFYGVAGMSTRNKFNDEFNRLCGDRPRFVFMILGGNSISMRMTPSEIVSDINYVLDELRNCGVERVFVAGILPRGQFREKAMTADIFNKIRRSVNDKLKKNLSENFVDMGVNIRWKRHFLDDGVHPNPAGMERLKRIILRTFTDTL